MPRIFFLLFLPLLLAAGTLRAQQTAVLSGTVRDDTGNPLEFVLVAVTGTATGTHTDAKGKYRMEVPAGQQLQVVFSYSIKNKIFKTITLTAGETATLDAVISMRYMELGEAVVRDMSRRGEAGAIYLDPAQAQYMASPVGGIEGMIKMFTGYNNELTSQYTVRGGNYDENLVYVNDFEIYRPFLTRSGQQDGLSGVNFSLGGFQAKYGDKMSSVLDVTYRRPKQFGGSVTASLLGASMHLEGLSKNEKLTYLVGLRQKSNQYLLQAQPTKGVYNPTFTDFQALVNYRFNEKWEMEAIGNYARNRFTFRPEEQTASFGVINQAYQLRMFYDGGEIDQFDSRFAGLSTTWRPNQKLRLKLLASGFQTDERETYDIHGEYLLGELETDMAKENFGQVKTYLGTGIIHNYARNYLKINVGNLAHRGSYSAGRHFVQWGVDANPVSIRDQLHEWERRDSAGFTQPYYPDQLLLTKVYSSASAFDYMRYSGFVQDNFRFSDSLDLTVSAGVRFIHSTLNGETVISPRVQISYKPEWESDVVFKLAGGMYAQPPFYREMRDLDGTVNQSLRMQKSTHLVAGTDHNFKWGRRPLKLTTEVYYKRLTDIVPYEYDNVRIRYFGRNNAEGYAYGGEVRLYGDLVKDAPSWLSVGLMKTMEDITDDQVALKDAQGNDSLISPGFIPRPTDQRLMFGMYFQDYLPRNKNFRMHLNLMYATGLPFGPPDKQRYGDTLRLPAYRRVDIGFSALLLDGAKKERKAYSFFRELNSIWASLEVFNLLGIRNTLSYTWIQDQTSGKTYAVPNRLTSRLVNLKIIVKF
jgi:hypothetical protein